MMDNETLFTKNWMSAYQLVVNRDREMSWVGQYMDCKFIWQIGESPYLIEVKSGKIASIEVPTLSDSWDFSLEGPVEAWHYFVQVTPPPFYQDVLGMVTHVPECHLKGNRLVAMQNIRALLCMLSLAREV